MSARKTEPDKSAAAAKKTPPAAKTAASKTKTTSSSARVKLGISPTVTLKTVNQSVPLPERQKESLPSPVVSPKHQVYNNKRLHIGNFATRSVFQVSCDEF